MKVSKRTRRVLAAVCAVTAAVALDVRLRTVTYTVVTDKVTAPVRLAVLADLHSCVYGPGQRTLLEAVAAAEPDGVLLAGDIVDDAMPEEPAWTAMEALAADYPCFYVTGNHEWWTGEVERICRRMEALRIPESWRRSWSGRGRRPGRAVFPSWLPTVLRSFRSICAPRLI